jgi:dimethylhistidine N-methyltransferase
LQENTVRVLRDAEHESLVNEVLAGLRAPQKWIPSKLLYDARGSQLFEQICELEEYYLTRTELAIMESHAREIADRIGENCLLIEYGSGSGRKTRLLLDHLRDPCAYIPIDISRDALDRVCADLSHRYPRIPILPLCSDYTQHYELPSTPREPRRRVIYFPGSTIGNFTPEEAREFLKHLAEVGGPGGGILIGVDLDKDPRILEPAYDDAAAVTKAFKMNLLTRINREAGADFRLDRFEYMSFYNPALRRIEMYLVSQEDQKVRIGDATVSIRRGERIQTEWSYKYTSKGFANLAAIEGLQVEQVWTDPDLLFSVQYLAWD